MPRGRKKIKSKVVRSTIENKDVLDMFHGVLGTGDDVPLNLKIVYPKYLNVKTHCERFVRLLEALRDSTPLAQFRDISGALARYTAGVRAEIDKTFFGAKALHPHRSSRSRRGYTQTTQGHARRTPGVFEGLQNDQGLQHRQHDRRHLQELIPHKRSLIDQKNLKDGFFSNRPTFLSPAPRPGRPQLQTHLHFRRRGRGRKAVHPHGPPQDVRLATTSTTRSRRRTSTSTSSCR